MKKFQMSVLRFLQSGATNIIVPFFIFVSIGAVIAGSFESMMRYSRLLFAVTYISSFVFLLEYAARIFSAPALRPDRRPFAARMRYVFSFFGLVDFVGVLPCLLTYFYSGTHNEHLIILPYVFIMFKLLRHSRSFRVIGNALRSVKDELAAAYTASLIMIAFSAILMYWIERNAQPEVFSNIGDGMWWCIVAFTTTGYGDIYPVTPLGKFLGSIISLIGIAMIALPTGIVGSAFINVFQKRNAEGGDAKKGGKENRSGNENCSGNGKDAER